MKSKFFFHFFLFLFGFFIGNLFPTFFGQLIGSATSFFLLVIFEFFHFITCGGIYPASRNLDFKFSMIENPYVSYPRSGSSNLNNFFSKALSVINPVSLQKADRARSATLDKVGLTKSPFSHFQTFNSIKIGILFGLFVDAFKVGS